MRFFAPALTTLFLAACGEPAAVEAPAPVPDPSAQIKIFTGGIIYTGLDEPKTVEGVLVDGDGRIMAVIPPMSADWGDDDARIVDLKGAVMYPGFVDAHAHLLGIGERERTLNLEGTASIDELVTRLEAELQGVSDGAVMVGRGWIETGWPEGRMPVAADLDPVSGGYKVILVRSDGHAMVVNTATLEAANITDETPDPAGGRIERDAAGHATGLLIDNAMGLVGTLIAEPDATAKAEALAKGASVYVSRGWTGVHNMSVGGDQAAILQALDGEGRMPLRLNNAFDLDSFATAEMHTNETDTIRNRSVKLYMDGALGSRGALLIQPYSDRPEASGLALTEPDVLAAIMKRAKDANVQLAIHAIGDLANRRILEAVEAGEYGKELRWRIEHTQVLAPEDIARVGADGLIASMQPSHAIGDLKFAPARLGLQRLGGAYAWKSLLDSGAVIAGGSDAPVEVGSPLIEFYAAVARKALDGTSGEGWHPEQALTREQALALFTSAPAYAAFQEDDLGTIEVGKIADFTVFDRDLMTVPEAEILEAQPVMTVVGGEIVWEADTD